MYSEETASPITRACKHVYASFMWLLFLMLLLAKRICVINNQDGSRSFFALIIIYLLSIHCLHAKHTGNHQSNRKAINRNGNGNEIVLWQQRTQQRFVITSDDEEEFMASSSISSLVTSL